jgi:hypothetical protein
VHVPGSIGFFIEKILYAMADRDTVATLEVMLHIVGSAQMHTWEVFAELKYD